MATRRRFVAVLDFFFLLAGTHLAKHVVVPFVFVPIHALQMESFASVFHGLAWSYGNETDFLFAV